MGRAGAHRGARGTDTGDTTLTGKVTAATHLVPAAWDVLLPFRRRPSHCANEVLGPPRNERGDGAGEEGGSFPGTQQESEAGPSAPGFLPPRMSPLQGIGRSLHSGTPATLSRGPCGTTGEGLTSPVCSSGGKTLFSGGHPTDLPFDPRSAQSGTRSTLQLMVSGSSAPVTDSGPTCQRQHLCGEGKDQNVTTVSSHFFFYPHGARLSRNWR